MLPLLLLLLLMLEELLYYVCLVAIFRLFKVISGEEVGFDKGSRIFLPLAVLPRCPKELFLLILVHERGLVTLVSDL